MLNKFTNLNGNVRPVSFMLIIIVIPTSLSPCPEILSVDKITEILSVDKI